MEIGRFYLKRNTYLSALKRFNNVVRNYSDTNQIEEAAYRIVEINLTLGLATEAIKMASILGNNYPSSPWYKMAYKLVNKYAKMG